MSCNFFGYSSLTKAFLGFAFALACSPATSFAVPCSEIIDTGSYRTSSKFTQGPGYVGCYLGQGLGALIGVPVTAVYAPIYAACEDKKDCEKYKSPIEDGAAFGGNVFSHAIGFPFFLLETIFSGGGSAPGADHG